MHPKIQRAAAEGQPKDLLIVLYGIGGIGKTTTACQAPTPLVLDCAGGLRFQSVDTWKIGGARDLAEAVAYAKAAVNGNGNGGFPYRSLVLDGLDHLYHRTVKTREDATCATDTARHRKCCTPCCLTCGHYP
jgi:hypothetical protein